MAPDCSETKETAKAVTSGKKMTEEEKTIIRQILTTQDSGQRLYFQMQAQLNALTTALIEKGSLSHAGGYRDRDR
ncbi:MAG: hypothetical protein ABSB15_07065 [Bryobacteraceae bacterium]|jgi:hypothetical protein